VYGISLEEFAEQVTANYEKYKDMLVAFLRAHGPAPKTKLAKLLYLADFGWFYFHLASMSGMPYRKLQYGPVPDAYFRAVDELESAGKICIDRTSVEGKDIFLVSESASNARVATTILSLEEQKLITTIARKWKSKKTAEIVNFTHNQLPYSICRPGEVIPYVLISQEDTENVY
jgi:Protein of unknown function (DUF4065)